MSVKFHKLGFINDENFFLIALHSNVEIFFLAYLLNKNLKTSFKKMKNNFEIINNRKAAIRRSLDYARDKYLVLLLGKGNESKIIYKDREIYHNDIKFVESLIK